MFKLSARAIYAATAVLVLARQGGEGLVQAQKISADHQIPPKYLEQILAALARGGIVRSARGAGGGYALARPATEITLEAVIIAVEGTPIPTSIEMPAVLAEIVLRAQTEVSRILAHSIAELLADEEAYGGVSYCI
ncbi:MAG: hypothetical protein AUK47_08920 [Deltaproteobacteria bacterium CG2_30_63_29]|nr:MAG: hypothetical protein AUK47_08920 [Deltaproteobacteria bacterium CG2_30_63_29]PJB49331.1 MAG: transcriptional regulator [Deltaproteobacteria bacterium CG_4_9_14_3_um_filter_63_12]